MEIMENNIDSVLFGAAYYDEYMPYDRLAKDVEMIKAAGMNVVRIAESTWSTLEPSPGVFDFSHIDRVLDAMEEADIHIIVGTPTYAVPTWLAKRHPNVLAKTHEGQQSYGPRQIMNIADRDYRQSCESVIRHLMDHVSQRAGIIGYQVDNETKYYDVVSSDVQQKFVAYLWERFNGDLSLLNQAFGLDYWSNRINSWNDFPDITNTINASLGGEFDKFRRSLVSDFIGWQADIVREYARPEQFVTQNFDLEWRGYSYGVQPWADDFKTSRHLDYAGVDIYHHSESRLTGKEIAFGGDLARSFKDGKNYLVLETEAQGQNGWLPYPGQLRLQAYSHLAGGSNSVMYWHWHSIHNSFETYWKGVLSQDLEPNATYEEASQIGAELKKFGDDLVNLQKNNRVAIMVSNESLTGLQRFTIETGWPDPHPYTEAQSGLLDYNDVVRRVYDALFELNVECDFVTEDTGESRLSQYRTIITPALYSAKESCIQKLRSFVEKGGHLISTFKSFFSDDDLTVYDDIQPHGLTDVFGMKYSQFTRPCEVGLEISGSELNSSSHKAEGFMELLIPDEETDVLARYANRHWKQYAAITRHNFGKGSAEWIGTLLDAEAMRMVLKDALEANGEDVSNSTLPVLVRSGMNSKGKKITYLLNYSDDAATFESPVRGRSLISQERVFDTSEEARTAVVAEGEAVSRSETVSIEPWGVLVIEGD